MTLYLTKEQHLQNLRDRIAVVDFLRPKISDYRRGLDPADQEDEETERGESAAEQRLDQNRIRREFVGMVNRIFKDATDSHYFQTHYPADRVKYFGAIFPKLQSTFRGVHKPDPKVVMSAAEEFSKKLGAKTDSDATDSAPGGNPVYECQVCGKTIKNPSSSKIEKHNNSNFHQKHLVAMSAAEKAMAAIRQQKKNKKGGIPSEPDESLGQLFDEGDDVGEAEEKRGELLEGSGLRSRARAKGPLGRRR